MLRWRVRRPDPARAQHPLMAARSWTWLILVSAAVLACARPQAPTRPPNIVLIVADDQRFDALSVVQREQGEFGRFPWLRTAALDRLAREGVRLRNAFAVYSLCSPSRASILTGRYPHAVGVLDNHTAFPQDAPTFAHALAARGYRTGYFGKWHMGRQSGPRPGFAHSASYLGHGEYFDCEFEVDGVRTPTQGWVDDVSLQFAERFVRQQREQPFLVVLGLKSGHSPFEPPDTWRGVYADDEPRPTPNLDVPSIYSKWRGTDAQRAARLRRQGRERDGVELEVERDLDHGYFETLSAADDALGRLLALLDELELAHDTLVVFTSDNGMYLGEHGLRDKRTAYEESIRTPLIVRYPRRLGAGVVRDELTLSVDIAPTLLDYAGVRAPPELHGTSLRAVLEAPEDGPAPARGWRDSFFYAYVAERGSFAPSVTALRTSRHKLVVYPGRPQWTELFDLRDDPYETHNLAGRLEYAELLAELLAERDRRASELRFPDLSTTTEREFERSPSEASDESDQD